MKQMTKNVVYKSVVHYMTKWIKTRVFFAISDFNEENPKVGVEESGIDVTKYKYPFTNMVCEGGGIKGLAYCGVARVSISYFEEEGYIIGVVGVCSAWNQSNAYKHWKLKGLTYHKDFKLYSYCVAFI